MWFMCPGHHWFFKIRDAGNGTSCKKKFNLGWCTLAKTAVVYSVFVLHDNVYFPQKHCAIVILVDENILNQVMSTFFLITQKTMYNDFRKKTL